MAEDIDFSTINLKSPQNYNRIIKEDSVIITRQNTERSSNFEMLRIIAMFMIVAGHYAGHGVRHILVPSASKIWLTGSFINRSFTSFLIPGGKIGVGLFFALTGYFMIDKEYKVQRLLKIILEVYFYSILMIIIWGGVQMCSIYSFPYMSSNNKLWLLLEVFFPITSNSWWFVTSYIILFLMIPVLNQIFVNVEGKFSFPFIVLFLFILYMTSVFDFKYQGIQRAVCFYLVGAWMKKNQITFCKWGSFLFFCFSWCVFIFCDMIITGNIGQGVTGKVFKIFFESIEILFAFIAVISLLSFFSVIKIKTNQFINTVASTTFGIYLFHDSNIGRQLIWDGIFHTLDKQYMSLFFPLFAFVSVIIVFTCATIIDFVRQKYFEKWLLSLVENKINRIARR